MIKIRRSGERGHMNHGWLDTYHTFSFGTYHDPAHTHFGVLRVINQDRVVPGAGFPTHGHENMEIISYVLDGVLEHRDSMGNGTQIRPGDVQLMSAGTGVTHSEFNGSKSEPCEFLQMWVFPTAKGTEPRYEQTAFSVAERTGRLRLVVSPDGADGSITIGQDVRVFAGILNDGDRVEHVIPPGRKAWLHVARGSLQLGDERLDGGDGAGLDGEPGMTLTGVDGAEFVVFDLP